MINELISQLRKVGGSVVITISKPVLERYGLKAHATKNPKIIHRIIKSDSGRYNYKIERFHNTLRERTKVFRGFHGSLESARAIMKGYEIYYNFITKHQALNCCPYELLKLLGKQEEEEQK